MSMDTDYTFVSIMVSVDDAVSMIF